MVIRNLMVVMVVLSMSANLFAQTQSMQIAGVARTYIVHAPSGLSNPPLVFNIHGYNMDAASEQSYTKMDQIADREKFIVVYPNAINKSWDLSGANDFAFILAIIDTVDKKNHINKDRIYSCGFSQGGFMSFQLACRYSDIFAAIAPTSGTLNGTCTIKRPLSMRLTFGTEDVATPAQFMASVTTWLNLCNCPKTPVVTRPYPSSNSNSVVTRLYYGPCDQGTEVIADSIRTGQHEWPMNTSDRINNSEETWSFLKKFTLKGNTGISQNVVPAFHDRISASYMSGIVRLQGTGEKCRVRVIDTRGRLVVTTVTAQRQFSFKNQPGGVYILLLNEYDKRFTLRLLIP
jgi:poly(3-hydroxybutyrate) depolymerase